MSTSSICEIEETEDDSVTTRFYDISISATDDAVNTGTKICSVIVVPDDHYSKSGKSRSVDGIGKSGKSSHNPDDLREEYKLSTKRYVISELSLEWNPNLNTTLVIPPLPERDINSKAGKGSFFEEKGSKSQGNSNVPDPFMSIVLDEDKGSKDSRVYRLGFSPPPL